MRRDVRRGFDLGIWWGGAVDRGRRRRGRRGTGRRSGRRGGNRGGIDCQGEKSWKRMKGREIREFELSFSSKTAINKFEIDDDEWDGSLTPSFTLKALKGSADSS